MGMKEKLISLGLAGSLAFGAGCTTEATDTGYETDHVIESRMHPHPVDTGQLREDLLADGIVLDEASVAVAAVGAAARCGHQGVTSFDEGIPGEPSVFGEVEDPYNRLLSSVLTPGADSNAISYGWHAADENLAGICVVKRM